MKIRYILDTESNMSTLMNNSYELFLRMCYSFVIDIILLIASTVIMVVAMHKEYDSIMTLIVYMALFVFFFGTSLRKVIYYKEYFMEFIDYVKLSIHVFSILTHSTEEDRINLLSQLPPDLACYYGQKLQSMEEKLNEEN